MLPDEGVQLGRCTGGNTAGVLTHCVWTKKAFCRFMYIHGYFIFYFKLLMVVKQNVLETERLNRDNW